MNFDVEIKIAVIDMQKVTANSKQILSGENNHLRTVVDVDQFII